MKVSHNQIKSVCERKASGTVRLHGVEVEEMHEFKYLGYTVQS